MRSHPFYPVVLMLFLAFNLYSQDQRVLDNYKLLIKDGEILSSIDNGIFPHPALEIALLNEFKEVANKNYPLKVALDPGHVAGNKKESIIEQRYLNTQFGFIYESELNMATCLLLKKKLEERGFEVLITRPANKSALDISYTDWFKKVFKTQLKEDLDNGFVSKKKYDELIGASKEEVFDKYFKDLDFIARAKKINAFAPDITIMVHYNASEFDNSTETYAPLVDHNYSVAFVPGGFTAYEISRESQMDEFIRLASTDGISKSIQLASFIIKEFEDKLGAPALLPEQYSELWYLKKYSVYTNTPGVFARNLYMTRVIKGPLCYAECFLQNNRGEIELLNNRTYKIGPYKVSERVVDVADAYYSGIIKYFKQLEWIK